MMLLLIRKFHFIESWVISLVLVATFVGASAGFEVSIEMLDTELSGELVQLTPDHISINQGGIPVELALAQVLKIRLDKEINFNQVERNQKGEIKLSDGSCFFHTDWQTQGRENSLQFTNQSFTDKKFMAPMESIHAWRLPVPCLLAELAFWDDLVGSSPLADWLVIRRQSNGELKPIEGVIEQISEEGVLFRIDEDTLSVGWDRIFGMIFFQQDRVVTSGPEVKFNDGSHFVSEAVFYKANRVSLRTPAGGSLQTSLDTVYEIDYSAGKIFSLSELPILDSYWQRPGGMPAQLEFTPRMNRSFENKPLQLAEQDQRLPGLWESVEYPEGVALRSNSQLTFSLPEGVRWLEGKVGIDPATRQTGSVEFVVLINKKVLARYKVDGADAPQTIQIALPEVTHERQLTLSVLPGVSDVGDNLHFVGARVTK